MIKNLLWVCILGPVSLLAQEKGIVFSQNLGWQEILQKAEKEHKYIFVDCYASWCGPCKQMDKTVYIDDSIGEVFNENFISIKVQIDSAISDAEDVKKWYETAHKLGQKYHINAFPTFLFFSPEGLELHKAIGARNKKDFLELARDAMNPHKQYFTLLRLYEGDRLSFNEFPSLAKCAQELHDTSLTSHVSAKYINYLRGLPSANLWTKDHIEFILNHKDLIQMKDSVFVRFFDDRNRINEVMSDSEYANRVINYVIYNEKVKPLVVLGVKSNSEPNWRHIQRFISKKYGQTYAEKNVIAGKVAYYRNLKRWRLYSKYFVLNLKLDKIDNWPADLRSSLDLNNYAFEVFKYSNNKSELETALSWVNKAISIWNGHSPTLMDTKANILYKLGRKEEGLEIEAESASLAPKDKEIQIALQKMKSGLPTWPVE